MSQTSNQIQDKFITEYEERFTNQVRKKRGEFFTPKSVADLICKLAKIEPNMTIYDPTCGSGRLFLSLESINHKIFGVEIDQQNVNFALENLKPIFGDVEIKCADVLRDPILDSDSKLKQYDRVIANIPFGTKLEKEIRRNEIFILGDIKKGQGDMAFLLHTLATMRQRGIIVCSNGMLFNNAFSRLREHLIKMDYVEAVIQLPPKMFFGSGVAAVILVLNKSKSLKKTNKICFIDSSNNFTLENKQNIFESQHIEKIISTIDNMAEVEKFSHITTNKEIEENEFNFNIPRYVDTSDPEPEYDLVGLLNDVMKMELEAQGHMASLVKSLQDTDMDMTGLNLDNLKTLTESAINPDTITPDPVRAELEVKEEPEPIKEEIIPQQQNKKKGTMEDYFE